MRQIYWRPHKVRRVELVLVALLAVTALFVVENRRKREPQAHLNEKIAASRLARDAFDAIKGERLRRGAILDAESDPAQSGLMGTLMSPITSNSGHLPAKQTTINPNWAAVTVDMLKRVGIEPGDAVAVGLSGSFPALNVCVLAALETLKARAIVTSSISGSQWGANDPHFTWVDMETLLHTRRLISFRSAAVSRGGIEDRGIGLSREGRAMLDEAARRNGLPLVIPKDYAESVERRMATYREQAAGASIRAYINVGGGTTSVGTHIGKTLFRPGLNRSVPIGMPEVDSVMLRFAQDGVPVIHFTSVLQLAARYGMPVAPAQIPAVGQGKVFFREETDRMLALAALGLLFFTLFGLIRRDWGFRLMGTGRSEAAPRHPERMV